MRICLSIAVWLRDVDIPGPRGERLVHADPWSIDLCPLRVSRQREGGRGLNSRTSSIHGYLHLLHSRGFYSLADISTLAGLPRREAWWELWGQPAVDLMVVLCTLNRKVFGDEGSLNWETLESFRAALDHHPTAVLELRLRFGTNTAEVPNV